jgi:RND family efflux transporter MFP subunit
MSAPITGYRQQEHLLPALLLLIAASALFAGCGEKKAPVDTPVKRQIISGVSVMTLAPTVVAESYEATGTVRAANINVVSSRMMGVITSLHVKEGDNVEKGQLLLTIDDRDVQQRVKAAEAGHQEALRALEAAGQNRGLAENTYERYKKMYEEKAISRQEMDQFETQKRLADLEYGRVQEMVNRAAAGLDEAKIYLGFTRVTSPVTGVVTARKTEIGSMAAPGMPLLTVENAAVFHAEVAIDESLSGKLRTGEPVTVSIESINRQLSGKISEILPAVDPQSRTFTIKVLLSGAGLRSGLYAKVQIPKGKREILLAPRTAIVEKGQLTGVYALDSQGIVSYRLIRTGRHYDDHWEVLSGLKPADRIIVQGVEKAIDGGTVETGK